MHANLQTPSTRLKSATWKHPKPSHSRRSLVVRASEARVVQVKFSIHKQVRFGLNLAVTGSCKELSSWGTGVKLKWTEGHNWTVTLEMPPGSTVEYKYVVFSTTANESFFEWQPGSNMSVTVPEEAAECTVINTWDGKTTVEVTQTYDPATAAPPVTVAPVEDISSLQQNVIVYGNDLDSNRIGMAQLVAEALPSPEAIADAERQLEAGLLPRAPSPTNPPASGAARDSRSPSPVNPESIAAAALAAVAAGEAAAAAVASSVSSTQSIMGRVLKNMPVLMDKSVSPSPRPASPTAAAEYAPLPPPPPAAAAAAVPTVSVSPAAVSAQDRTPSPPAVQGNGIAASTKTTPTGSPPAPNTPAFAQLSLQEQLAAVLASQQPKGKAKAGRKIRKRPLTEQSATPPPRPSSPSSRPVVSSSVENAVFQSMSAWMQQRPQEEAPAEQQQEAFVAEEPAFAASAPVAEPESHLEEVFGQLLAVHEPVAEPVMIPSVEEAADEEVQAAPDAEMASEDKAAGQGAQVVFESAPAQSEESASVTALQFGEPMAAETNAQVEDSIVQAAQVEEAVPAAVAVEEPEVPEPVSEPVAAASVVPEPVQDEVTAPPPPPPPAAAPVVSQPVVAQQAVAAAVAAPAPAVAAVSRSKPKWMGDNGQINFRKVGWREELTQPERPESPEPAVANITAAEGDVRSFPVSDDSAASNDAQEPSEARPWSPFASFFDDAETAATTTTNAVDTTPEPVKTVAVEVQAVAASQVKVTEPAVKTVAVEPQAAAASEVKVPAPAPKPTPAPVVVTSVVSEPAPAVSAAPVAPAAPAPVAASEPAFKTVRTSKGFLRWLVNWRKEMTKPEEPEAPAPAPVAAETPAPVVETVAASVTARDNGAAAQESQPPAPVNDVTAAAAAQPSPADIFVPNWASWASAETATDTGSVAADDAPAQQQVQAVFEEQSSAEVVEAAAPPPHLEPGLVFEDSKDAEAVTAAEAAPVVTDKASDEFNSNGAVSSEAPAEAVSESAPGTVAAAENGVAESQNGVHPPAEAVSAENADQNLNGGVAPGNEPRSPTPTNGGKASLEDELYRMLEQAIRRTY